MERLGGKAAIITGGGSGIGRAAALRFAQEGAKVLVVGRTESKIDETVRMVREAGGTFTSIDGQPGPHHGSALATNGLLHERVLHHLR